MRKFLGLPIAVLAIAGTSVTPSTAAPYGMTREAISRAVVTGEPPVVQFRQRSEVEVMKIVLEPGGTTGWHRHPAQAVFLIDKGSAASYGLDGPPCEPVEWPAGTAWFAGEHAHHSHLVRNTGSERMVATVLYFNLAPGQAGAVAAERPKECPADLN